MKIVVSKKARIKGISMVTVLFLSLALLFTLGMYVGGNYPGVFAAETAPDQFQIRSKLLQDAVDKVGSCSLDEAVTLWADGLKSRSAAMQYAAMSSALKQQYAAQLDETFPNWVTGVSSPHVESYKIEKKEDLGNGRFRVILSFSLATSSGPAGTYKAVLNLAREGSFWRITALSTDNGLYPYTGFKPLS